MLRATRRALGDVSYGARFRGGQSSSAQIREVTTDDPNRHNRALAAPHKGRLSASRNRKKPLLYLCGRRPIRTRDNQDRQKDSGATDRARRLDRGWLSVKGGMGREDLTMTHEPLSKRNDSWSSYQTSEHIRRHAATQRQEVLDTLRLYGPLTGAEIGVKMGGDRYAGHRRLPELERAGLVERNGFRKCNVTRRQCQVWRAVKIEKDLFGNILKKEVTWKRH